MCLLWLWINQGLRRAPAYQQVLRTWSYTTTRNGSVLWRFQMHLSLPDKPIPTAFPCFRKVTGDKSLSGLLIQAFASNRMEKGRGLQKQEGKGKAYAVSCSLVGEEVCPGPPMPSGISQQTWSLQRVSCHYLLPSAIQRWGVSSSCTQTSEGGTQHLTGFTPLASRLCLLNLLQVPQIGTR